MTTTARQFYSPPPFAVLPVFRLAIAGDARSTDDGPVAIRVTSCVPASLQPKLAATVSVSGAGRAHRNEHPRANFESSGVDRHAVIRSPNPYTVKTAETKAGGPTLNGTRKGGTETGCPSGNDRLNPNPATQVEALSSEMLPALKTRPHRNEHPRKSERSHAHDHWHYARTPESHLPADLSQRWWMETKRMIDRGYDRFIARHHLNRHSPEWSVSNWGVCAGVRDEKP